MRNEWNFFSFLVACFNFMSIDMMRIYFLFDLVWFGLIWLDFTWFAFVTLIAFFNMILDLKMSGLSLPYTHLYIFASPSPQITSCLLHFDSLLNNKNSCCCHFKFLFSSLISFALFRGSEVFLFRKKNKWKKCRYIFFVVVLIKRKFFQFSYAEFDASFVQKFFWKMWFCFQLVSLELLFAGVLLLVIFV